MQKLKAIVVDDESQARDMLKLKLSTYCAEVEIVGEADSFESAKKMLNTAFDLAFLDIKLNGKLVFDLLEKLPSIGFNIIFTTAYEEYMLNAIRLSAIDYLVKPIAIEELMEAVSKVAKKGNSKEELKLETLFHNMKNEPWIDQKVVINTAEAMHLIKLNQIIRCEADINYTHIILEKDEPILSSKTLKEYEHMLQAPFFQRVHQSHLVNMEFVKRFDKRSGMLVMENGDEVSISKSYKPEVLNYFK